MGVLRIAMRSGLIKRMLVLLLVKDMKRADLFFVFGGGGVVGNSTTLSGGSWPSQML